jgi:hypothetical protein
MPGFVVSRTVTVKEQVPVLFEASVANAVTVWFPSEKSEPASCEYVIARPSVTSSEAVAFEYETIEPEASIASVTTFSGHETVGAVESRTVTVKEQLAVLPELSVAHAVTTVAPRASVAPDAEE